MNHSTIKEAKLIPVWGGDLIQDPVKRSKCNKGVGTGLSAAAAAEESWAPEDQLLSQTPPAHLQVVGVPTSRTYSALVVLNTSAAKCNLCGDTIF